MSESEGEEALDTAAGMLEMYKSGFLDGHMLNHPKKKAKKEWNKIKEKCRKCFEEKFRGLKDVENLPV